MIHILASSPGTSCSKFDQATCNPGLTLFECNLLLISKNSSKTFLSLRFYLVLLSLPLKSFYRAR